MIKVEKGQLILNGTVKELRFELSRIVEALYKNLRLVGCSEKDAEHRIMSAFETGIAEAWIEEMEEKNADR